MVGRVLEETNSQKMRSQRSWIIQHSQGEILWHTVYHQFLAVPYFCISENSEVESLTMSAKFSSLKSRKSKNLNWWPNSGIWEGPAKFKKSGIRQVRQSGDPPDSLVSSQLFPPAVRSPANTDSYACWDSPFETSAHDGSNVSEYPVRHFSAYFSALWAIPINRAVIISQPTPFVFVTPFNSGSLYSKY